MPLGLEQADEGQLDQEEVPLYRVLVALIGSNDS